MVHIKSIQKSSIILLLLTYFFYSFLWSCTSSKINTAINPVDKLQYKWWADRHQTILNQKSGNPELILIGNSIMHSLDDVDKKTVWEKYLNKYNTLNMGFSADRTENVIWRIQNGELANINPKIALILIGTNNTDGNHFASVTMPDELGKAIWKICELTREKLPNTQILLLGILPYGSNQPNYRNTINQKTNELISKFPNKDKNIHYRDIGSIFLNEDGEIIRDLMPDFLHPNAKGHLLLFKTLQPVIEKIKNSNNY